MVSRRVPLIWFYCEQDKRGIFNLILLLQLLFYQTKLYVLYASGQRAHGGVALLWRYSIDDFVSPIENIDSDRIVGIKYELNGIKPLFILSVYLPSSSHTTEEYRECLDLLWSLCNSLSVDGYPVVLGDLNGDLGNSLGEIGTKEPNERGRLLLNFADYFNVCPVNLLSLCEGPLVTYNSFCGKYRSTIDYIFPVHILA